VKGKEIKTDSMKKQKKFIGKTEKPFTEGDADICSKRHVLIIGGAGYIGSVLTKKLLSKGWKVMVLDKLLYDNGSVVADLMEDDGFSFKFGDFGNNDILTQVLNKITDVVLLASLVGDPICKKYPELARKINIDYPKNLLRRLNRKNIIRFIFTSTCSNYGLRPDNSIANEESELNPQSLYAETKIEIEKFILENAEDFDYSSTILRLGTAFGISKRMRFDLTISEFTRNLALNNKLIVYDENTWRPYCHVSDISNTIIRVLEIQKEKINGQVFNIGCSNYTKKMIIESIKKFVNDPKIEYQKGGSDPRNFRVSFDKAHKILGFEPVLFPEDSIKQLVGSFRNNLYNDISERKNFYANFELMSQECKERFE
jgi:nucleoside-diphosphate-sugar epimerase